MAIAGAFLHGCFGKLLTSDDWYRMTSSSIWVVRTITDIELCNISARAVALIFNRWSWYVRLAHSKARLEVIIRQPLELAAVGKIAKHCGKIEGK